MSKVKKKKITHNFADINPEYSFLKGWGDLRQRDVEVAKQDLMDALNIKSDATFYRRLRGQIAPTIEEHTRVVHVFKKYGIKHPYGV